MSEVVSPLTDVERAELRRTAETALDELTAALTQVFKAVNKVHRVVSKLGIAIDNDIEVVYRKDHPNVDD